MASEFKDTLFDQTTFSFGAKFRELQGRKVLVLEEIFIFGGRKCTKSNIQISAV